MGGKSDRDSMSHSLNSLKVQGLEGSGFRVSTP